MFPFRDNIPSRSFPVITISIIVVNVLAFLYQLMLGPAVGPFVMHYGVVPAQVVSWPESELPVTAVALPFLTSIFLHGGWFHLIGNMWYLWIFGDNVEDRLGHFNYLVFYLVCGFGAGIAHTALNYNSIVPSVGASGAIAGVLGAYLISYPFAKVLTLVPIFMFVQIIEIPAIIVLGFWFIMQFLSGTASLATTTAGEGGVAWWAHVGGFVLGLLLVGVFPRKDRRQRYDDYA